VDSCLAPDYHPVMRAPGAHHSSARPAAFLLGAAVSLGLFVLAVLAVAPADAGILNLIGPLVERAEADGSGWQLGDALLFVVTLGTSQFVTAFCLARPLPRSSHLALAVGMFLPVAALMLGGFGLPDPVNDPNGRGMYYRPMVLIAVCGMSFLVPVLAASIAPRKQ